MTQQVKEQCKQKTCCHQPIKFQPLGNRVLIRRIEEGEKLKGGIILPDNAKKKQERGEVIAIGPGKRDKNDNLIPPPVKVGDTVLFEKYAGQEITINDEELTIVRGDDIVAIIEQ